MRIGILGSGHIGKTLVQRLSAAGHDVKVANSRGPETIAPDVLASGGRAVTAAEAVSDVDVVIVSIPLNRLPDVAPLLAGVPREVPVIDTSNYYPMRDGHIAEIDGGTIESVWVSERLGRPVIKAFNAVLASTFADGAQPSGTPGRIAIPVAGDDARAKAVAMALVDATGFDALDAGGLAESWRLQPGTPAYCTDLTADELRTALAAADRARAPEHREAVMRQLTALGRTPTREDLVTRNRAVAAPR
jgi:hypothetical protein